MLERLLLMRHAKSSWADGSMTDHERPLNKRGQKSAEAVGRVLHARGFAPDIIWSSDATRTRETSMQLIRSIPGAQVVEYISGFYHASLEEVLAIAEQKGEPEAPLMWLGHNPGWSDIHHYFTGHGHAYPTGACTILKRVDDGHWLSPNSWRMVDLILPREIMA